MKITVKWNENEDGCECQRMEIDGKKVLNVYPLCECPEDAIIGRDLVACSDVAGFMEKAYNAGKAGEPFEYEYVEVKDEE